MDGIQPESLQHFLKLTLTVGVTSFGLMLPILAGYISYSIAGKPRPGRRHDRRLPQRPP